MTKVLFETAAIADAIKKANGIAPTRGKEFDMYKGIYFEVRGELGNVCMRTSNGEIFYTEFLTPLEIEGDDVDWLLPSQVTAGIITNLPMGSGKTVTLQSEKGFLRMSSGRMRARVPIIVKNYFPDWEGFDASSYKTVNGFGTHLDQVAWAADKGNLPPLNGVYVDEKMMLATNRFRVAAVECEFPLPEDHKFLVLPSNTLAPIVRGIEEMKIGIEGNYLCMEPSPDVQIKCVMYPENYLNVSKAMSVENEEMVMLNRDIIIETLNRCMSVGTGDRQLPLKVVVGEEEISFHVRDETKTEEIEDSVYLKGQCEHAKVEYLFSPENFIDAMSKSPNREVIFGYNLSEQKKGVTFEGGSGYKCIVRPRIEMSNAADADGQK